MITSLLKPTFSTDSPDYRCSKQHVLLPAKGFSTLCLAFLFLLAAPFAALAQQNVAGHARSVITPYLLNQAINYLASDSMKGRGAGRELEAAGDYIAGQFKAYGLQPLKGDYFQDMGYCYFDLGADNFLSVVKDTATTNFKIGDDFVPYEMSGSKPAEGEVIFAGYGITAPEYNYDDYKDLDVKGKIVLVLRKEPGQTDSVQTLFAGMQLTRYSGLKEKQKMAQAHGAIGLLVVSGPLHYTSMRPRGFAWPSLSKILPKDALPMNICTWPEEHIPMIQVGEKVINDLFGNVYSLLLVQQTIEQTMQPASYRIRGKTMALNVSLTSKPVDGRNVIAFLEGSDPVLKDEAIVIGGHYDHIGFEKEHQAGSDYIYNGADDNASGTSGVLAIAKAFATNRESPKRSVIFVAFAGEEKGLLGSATYVAAPRWPLEKTAAMLNLDMISRNDPDSLELIGARQNPGLAKIVRKENKKVGFFLLESKRKRLDGGSDHASFFEKGIPVIFFFTGLHKDYHKVTDESGLIDCDKAAKVARLAFMTAWTVANEKKHYKILYPAVPEDE